MYATANDLDAKWGAEAVTLASWSETVIPPGRDPAKLIAALSFAAALVDGYLARRYALPIRPTDTGFALLKSLACDLAMGQLANTPATRTDIVIAAEDRATKFLRDIARGDAAIDVVLPETAQPAVSPGEAIVVGPGPYVSESGQVVTGLSALDRWGRL